MSATSKTFQVTVTATGTAFDMSAENVILIAPSGAGSRVLYDNGRGTNDIFVVTNTPLDISTASGYVIPVTSSSTTVYLNVDRIIDVIDSGSGAKIYFQQDIGAAPISYTVTETRSAIRTLIAGVVGSGGSGGVVTGITAFAGGGQASATALSYGYNEITTVVTALDSVKLPAGLVGAQVTVLNDGANIANIYPATSGTINDGAANSPVPIAPGVTLTFTSITATGWETTSQTVAAGDGTAPSPSITFESQDDMGFYKVGVAEIGAAITGAHAVSVISGGIKVESTIFGVSGNTMAIHALDSNVQAGLNISADNAVSGNKSGGALTLQGGNASGTAAGGATYIFGGNAGTVNSGPVLAATGRAPGGASGNVTIQTGTDSGSGGVIEIKPNESTVAIVSSTGLGVTGLITASTSITAGTTINAGTALTVGTDISLAVGANHNIQVTNQTVADTAGKNLSVYAANGLGTGAGGDMLINSGVGGATGVSGPVYISSGAGGGTSGNSGLVEVKSGGSTSGNTGVVLITSGNAAAGNSGDISISAGTASGTRGSLNINVNSVLNVDGVVGAPAYSFSSNPDTGLYAVSGTQTGFASNGVLVATFDGSGLTSDSLRARVNAGTTPVGTVSIVEYSDGKDITVELTLTNFIVGALAGAAANLGVGNIVYAFPAGQHLELVYSFSSIVLTALGTAVATDTGVGSVIASGAVAVLSGTATFEDRLTGQTINTAAGGGAAVSALTAATAGVATGIALNVAASVKNFFLNTAGAWNADNTGNLTATGKIYLKATRM